MEEFKDLKTFVIYRSVLLLGETSFNVAKTNFRK